MQIIFYPFSPEYLDFYENISKEFLYIVPEYKKDKFIRQENIYFVDSYDIDFLIELCEELIMKFDISKIISISEDSIYTAAYLNEYFNLKNNQSIFSALFYTDKLYMRRLLKKSDIKIPNFFKVDSYAGLIDTLDKVNIEYPLLLKPRNEAAAIGIYKLNNEEELKYMKDKDLSNYICEEFVPHIKVYTTDGIIENGKITNFFIHEYEEDILSSFKTTKSTIVRTFNEYTSKSSLVDKLYSQSQKIADLSNKENVENLFPFHFEWFLDDQGNIYFCEGAARFGGGDIPTLINLAYDVDIKKKYWDLLLNVEEKTIEVVKINSKIAATILPYCKNGTLISTPQIEEYDFCYKAKIYKKRGDIVNEANKVIDVHSVVILDSENERDFKLKLEKVKKLNEKFVFEVKND
ncbi:TPA: ATP-grasp domain-containing protein [Staphylococcus pseudintermedius]|nr:ATP-grasp domain-containing protein [Staphylococcus pseudintermedius]EJD8521214.1 ATP-grasp domain-containing protein [Staphylococcus pseudintermedius]HAR6574027.1 ATP-grasp domain-containing protein [Staphylococcus pseudintermedius]